MFFKSILHRYANQDGSLIHISGSRIVFVPTGTLLIPNVAFFW